MKDKLIRVSKVLEVFDRWANRIREEETDYSEEKLQELRLSMEGCMALVPEEAAPAEKSADELFREMGYTKQGIFEGVHSYRKKEHGETLKMDITKDGMCRCMVDMDVLPISKGELLACAQLIREMTKDGL